MPGGWCLSVVRLLWFCRWPIFLVIVPICLTCGWDSCICTFSFNHSLAVVFCFCHPFCSDILPAWIAINPAFSSHFKGCYISPSPIPSSDLSNIVRSIFISSALCWDPSFCCCLLFPLQNSFPAFLVIPCCVLFCFSATFSLLLVSILRFLSWDSNGCVWSQFSKLALLVAGNGPV